MEQLTEQIKTRRNLCDIALLVIEKGQLNQRVVLLPTILEVLYLEVADALEAHCIVDDSVL